MSSRKSNVVELKLTPSEEEEIARLRYGSQLYEQYQEIEKNDKNDNTNKLQLSHFADYLHHFGFIPQSHSQRVNLKTTKAKSTVTSTIRETKINKVDDEQLQTKNHTCTNCKSNSPYLNSSSEYSNKTFCSNKFNKEVIDKADKQSVDVGSLLELKEIKELSRAITAPFLQPNWRQDAQACAIMKARCVYNWLCDNIIVEATSTAAAATAIIDTIANTKNGNKDNAEYKVACANGSAIESTESSKSTMTANNENVNCNNKREKTVLVIDQSDDYAKTTSTTSTTTTTTTTTTIISDSSESRHGSREVSRRRMSSAKISRKNMRQKDRLNAENAAAQANTIVTKKDFIEQALESRHASPETMAVLYSLMLRAVDVECSVVHGEKKHLDNTCEPWHWNVVRIATHNNNNNNNNNNSSNSSSSSSSNPVSNEENYLKTIEIGYVEYLVDVCTAAAMTQHKEEQSKKINEVVKNPNHHIKKSVKEEKMRECEMNAKRTLTELMHSENISGYADPLRLTWEPIKNRNILNTNDKCAVNNNNNNNNNSSNNSISNFKEEQNNVFRNYVYNVRNYYFATEQNAFRMSHFPSYHVESEETSDQSTNIEALSAEHAAAHDKWEKQICLDHNFYEFDLQLSSETESHYDLDCNVKHIHVINHNPAQTELCGFLFRGPTQEVIEWYHNYHKSISEVESVSVYSLVNSLPPSNVPRPTSATITQNRKNKMPHSSSNELESSHCHSLLMLTSTCNIVCTDCVWHEREERTNTETFTIIFPETTTKCYTFVIAARHIRCNPYSAHILTNSSSSSSFICDDNSKCFIPVLIYNFSVPSFVSCRVPYSTRFAQRHLSPSIAKVLPPLSNMYACEEIASQTSTSKTTSMLNKETKYRFTIMPTCSNVEAVAVVVTNNSNYCKTITQSKGNDSELLCNNNVTISNAKTLDIASKDTNVPCTTEVRRTETIIFLPFNTETLCYEGEIAIDELVQNNCSNKSNPDDSNTLEKEYCDREMIAEVWLLYGAPDQNGLSLRDTISMTCQSNNERSAMLTEKMHAGQLENVIGKKTIKHTLPAKKDGRFPEHDVEELKVQKPKAKNSSNINNTNKSSKGVSGVHNSKTSDSYYEEEQLKYMALHEALNSGACFRRFVTNIKLKSASEQDNIENDIEEGVTSNLIKPILEARAEYEATLCRLVGVTPALYGETQKWMLDNSHKCVYDKNGQMNFTIGSYFTAERTT